jgi:hypothetical protein
MIRRKPTLLRWLEEAEVKQAYAWAKLDHTGISKRRSLLHRLRDSLVIQTGAFRRRRQRLLWTALRGRRIRLWTAFCRVARPWHRVAVGLDRVDQQIEQSPRPLVGEVEVHHADCRTAGKLTTSAPLTYLAQASISCLRLSNRSPRR